MLEQHRTVANTALTGSDQQVKSVGVTYHGINVRETAGATAVVRVYDNTASSGTLLDTIRLVANESVGTWYERGIRAAIGVRVDIVSGTVEGAIRTSA